MYRLFKTNKDRAYKAMAVLFLLPLTPLLVGSCIVTSTETEEENVYNSTEEYLQADKQIKSFKK